MAKTPDASGEPKAIRAGFRVSRTSWEAWGRVCGRMGSNRTARILDRMAEDIYAHGDDEDIAGFEAGLAEAELRRARRHIGRPPSPRPAAVADGHPDASGYMQVLERAMARARERYPHASPELRAAYANSVAYAVTGQSGGYGGPSAREYAAGQASRDYLAVTGQRRSFTEAAEEFGRPDGLIFGPLTDAHYWHWRNMPCSGDDPADAAALDSPGSLRKAAVPAARPVHVRSALLPGAVSVRFAAGFPRGGEFQALDYGTPHTGVPHGRNTVMPFANLLAATAAGNLDSRAFSEQVDKRLQVVPVGSMFLQEDGTGRHSVGLGLKDNADRGLAGQVPVDAVVPAAVPPGR